MQRSLKPLVIALVAIFVVCLIVTAILASAQILPDWRRMTALEPYEEQWVLDGSDGLDVDIDMTSVHVEVLPSDSGRIEAWFTGRRSPGSDGDAPIILVEESGGKLRIREQHTSSQALVRMDLFTGRIEGTLTLRLPNATYGRFRAETFSGDLNCASIQASSIDLETSSGALSAHTIQSGGDLRLTTFSDNMTLSGLSAVEKAELDASSGSIVIEEIEARSLDIETFSGRISLNDATVEGALRLKTSSGDIAGNRWAADTLSTEQFSGQLAADSARLNGNALCHTNSGRIRLQNFAAGELSLETFSGDVELSAADVQSIKADTTSGRVSAHLLCVPAAQIETFSGRVELTLPEDAAFSYDINTFSGKIRLAYGGEITGKEVQGSIGGGGSSIQIETSSGDITLKPASAQ